MKKAIKILKVAGIALGSILIIVSGKSKVEKSTINAEIKGLGTTLLFVGSASIDKSEIHNKVCFSFNDKINVKLPLQKTSEVHIKPVVKTLKRKIFRSKNIGFFLDPSEEIVIKGTAGDISVDYDIVKGNKLSFQLNELRKILQPYYEDESRLLYESFSLRKKNPKKSSQIEDKFDSLRFYVVAPLRTEWAKQHLDYELVPLFFLESHVPQDTVVKYFNLFPKNVRESEYGQILERFVLDYQSMCKLDTLNVLKRSNK